MPEDQKLMLQGNQHQATKKLTAFEQPEFEQDVNEEEKKLKEEEKRKKKREVERLRYLCNKKLLAEKKASMSEDQKLALLENQSQATEKYRDKKKAKLQAYEVLLPNNGNAEQIVEMDDSRYNRKSNCAANTEEEKCGDTDDLPLLLKKRQRSAQHAVITEEQKTTDFAYKRNTQQQSVITEEQKKINFAQKLQRNAQRKREAWEKARETQSAIDKAQLYSLKTKPHISEDTTNDATAQGATTTFPVKALHVVDLVGDDGGGAEVGGFHQEEQSSTTSSIRKGKVSTVPERAAKRRRAGK
jgi:hypothetical protein